MNPPGDNGPGGGSPGSSKRDRRLDIVRGLALIFIFVDHIPGNPLGWFTIRNYGFSDATEIFVFVSGYSAALAYGAKTARFDFPFTSARILRRCWQLYVAHILLFVIFAAHVASVTSSQGNPMFAEEMKVTSFLQDPETTLLQVLLLRFRPVNMDVLPLYIVLMLSFPLILPVLRRFPWLGLSLSAGLWLATRTFDLNLRTYPNGGVWYFDPSAWQFLFVIGSFAALNPKVPDWFLARAKFLDAPAVLYLLFALFVVLGWSFPALARHVPHKLGNWIYPIDKTALDPLRLIHFLCLAYLATRFVGRESPVVRFKIFRPMEACGRHSLEIFCLGTILSLMATIFIDRTNGSLAFHLAVTMIGITVMTLTALYLDWYQRREKELATARRKGSA